MACLHALSAAGEPRNEAAGHMADHQVPCRLWWKGPRKTLLQCKVDWSSMTWDGAAPNSTRWYVLWPRLLLPHQTASALPFLGFCRPDAASYALQILPWTLIERHTCPAKQHLTLEHLPVSVPPSQECAFKSVLHCRAGRRST